MRKTLITILLIIMCATAACSPGVNSSGSTKSTESQMTVYTVGAVEPLTGEGAVYGLPVQRVIDQAVADLNQKWASSNKKLVLEWDDGKCNGKDALSAAQNLVNIKGVKVIYGAGCSGETLGIAPFAESNKILLFSPLSSSPEITNAGDYVFRNYPSDNAQVKVLSAYLASKKYSKVALLSENTDYAQALRSSYNEVLPKDGINIVADEVVQTNAKDVRTEMLKIKESDAEAVILIPQTIPMAGVMAKQWAESGIKADGYGNEILNLGDTLKEYGKNLEGFVSPRAKFDEDSNTAFQDLKSKTECDLGYYCVTSYDGVFLLAEILEKCGDQDTACMKKEMYATKDWKGIIGDSYTFDKNGDVAGNFELVKNVDGSAVIIA